MTLKSIYYYQIRTRYRRFKAWRWDLIGRKWTYSQKFPWPWYWRNHYGR